MSEIFTPVDVQTNDTPVPQSLEDLVGPDKKYKTPEDLAKAVHEKDRFIQRLQEENAEARQAVTRQLTIEEILTQIKSATPPVNPSTPPEPRVPDQQQTPDVNEIVKQALNQREAENRHARNLEQVTQKLLDKFGADAQLHINKKAQELGVSVEYLQNQAKDNPNVFYRLIDIDRQTQITPPTPAPTGRQAANLPPANSGIRDLAYWQKLKAQDPKKYFSQEMILQRFKDEERAIKEGRPWR